MCWVCVADTRCVEIDGEIGEGGDFVAFKGRSLKA
jgi:hypothetical protein